MLKDRMAKSPTAWKAHAARLVGGSIALACLTGAAEASVVISDAATLNMICSGGVCSPTAEDAVLNASDLEAMLANGDVAVTTTGSGIEATDLLVAAPIAWSKRTTLRLDAFHSILVEALISVNGRGGLSFQTNDGGGDGELAFMANGRARLRKLSSPLTIDGQPFILIDTVASLASTIAANPSGNYALADNYDALGDGKYLVSPVMTTFQGKFEGLGNTVSHVTIHMKQDDLVGFFRLMYHATVENFGLSQLNLLTSGRYGLVGGLAGQNDGGTLSRDFVRGIIGADRKFSSIKAGGLVGSNGGQIRRSYANVAISIGNSGRAGGLVGEGGDIYESFSVGLIEGGDKTRLGGLLGEGTFVFNSYANVALSGGTDSEVGGFVGRYRIGGRFISSYSTGSVIGGTGSLVGGFAGHSGRKKNDVHYCYWDITTSGQSNGSGDGDPEGLAGLTDEQLKSGLPQGFDPAIWAQDPSINGGYPYLIANPPLK